MADYVNGKELTEELRQYAIAYKEAIASGKELPSISIKIAHGILQISERYARQHNFVNYTYRDEMAADAVLKCVRKAHLFDIERSSNSFAYISQICHNCFIERIKKEKHQMSVKARLIREKLPSEFIEHGGALDDVDASNSFVEFLKENDVLVDYYADSKENELNKHSSKIHPSLVHRNKTAYPTKKVQVQKVSEVEVDILDL